MAWTRPGMRVHGDDGARNLGDLAQAELAGLALQRLDIDDVAGAEQPGRRCGGSTSRRRPRWCRSRARARPGPRPRASAAGRSAPVRPRPRARPPAARAGRRRAPALRRARGPIRARSSSSFCCAPRQPRALVVAHEPVDERLAGHRLHLRIERGADRQAALVELLLAVALGDLAADLLGEVAGGDGVRARSTRGLTVSGSFLRLVGLLALDVAVLDHAIDDPVAALERRLLLAERMVVVRRLRQRRQVGGLGERQLMDRLAEIVQRRRGDAVIARGRDRSR